MTGLNSKLLTGIIVAISMFTLASGAFVIHAQESTADISISPALATIEPGSSYTLTITNNSDEAHTFEVVPAFFVGSAMESKIIAVPAGQEPGSASEYIRPEQTSPVVPSNASLSLRIDYLKSPDDLLAGVYVKLQGGEGAVGGAGQLASVIVSAQVSDDDLRKVGNELTLTPELGIADLNFGKLINIDTTIRNASAKILRPAGNIKIHTSNQDLETFPLTGKISSPLYPNASTTYSSSYTDERPFWQRLGTQKYTQTILFATSEGTKAVQVEKSVFSLPWESIAILIGILGVFTALLVTKPRFKHRYSKG